MVGSIFGFTLSFLFFIWVYREEGETMKGPCMILRGISHRMEMISLYDVHWLVDFVDEFSMMELKKIKGMIVWLDDLCISHKSYALTILVSAVKLCCGDVFWFGSHSVLVNNFCVSLTHMRYRFQCQLWSCVALMISELAATKFSSMISELVMNHVRWWFQRQLRNYVALMILKSSAA
jgi:hypothetical protein